jgi:phosphoglycerate dehydrogenase-like enzyme
MVADYGQAFRMRVLACDRKEIAPAPGVEMVDFPTLLRESDVLSIHIHLTPENRGFLGREALSRMKPGAILLNTSRGAVLDEAALLDHLESGHLGGAGLDVIDGEWSKNLTAHRLIRYANLHENLVISPHTGGITYVSTAFRCAWK